MSDNKRILKPGDIVYVDEFVGWVQALPCGPKDTVYTVAYNYRSARGLERMTTLVCGSVKHAKLNGYNFRVTEANMTPKRYPLIGRSVFVTREDAEKAISELKKGYGRRV